jgi:hypothetical protein
VESRRPIGLDADANGAPMRDPRRDERSRTMTSDAGDDAVKTRPLLAEHERLLDHVAHIRVAAIELPSLSEEERHELIERIVSFLRDDLARTQSAKSEASIPTWRACSAIRARPSRWSTTTTRSAN